MNTLSKIKNLLQDFKLMVKELDDSFKSNECFTYYPTIEKYLFYYQQKKLKTYIYFLEKIGRKEHFQYNDVGKLHSAGDKPSYIDLYKNQYWHKNGILHRDDGPAVILTTGVKKWYKEGMLHREDGPAIINKTFFIYEEDWYFTNLRHNPNNYSCYTKEFLQKEKKYYHLFDFYIPEKEFHNLNRNSDGVLHDENNPLFCNGDKKIFVINGKLISEQDFLILVEKRQLEHKFLTANNKKRIKI